MYVCLDVLKQQAYYSGGATVGRPEPHLLLLQPDAARVPWSGPVPCSISSFSAYRLCTLYSALRPLWLPNMQVSQIGAAKGYQASACNSTKGYSSRVTAGIEHFACLHMHLQAKVSSRLANSNLLL